MPKKQNSSRKLCFTKKVSQRLSMVKKKISQGWGVIFLPLLCPVAGTENFWETLSTKEKKECWEEQMENPTQEGIEKLLNAKKGKPIDRKRKEDGIALIHQIAIKGNKDLMELLLKNNQKVPINTRNKENQTILHLAAIRNQTDIMQSFVEYERRWQKGKKILRNSKDKNNKTPLQYAQEKNYTTIINLLNEIQEIRTKRKRGGKRKANRGKKEQPISPINNLIADEMTESKVAEITETKSDSEKPKQEAPRPSHFPKEADPQEWELRDKKQSQENSPKGFVIVTQSPSPPELPNHTNIITPLSVMDDETPSEMAPVPDNINNNISTNETNLTEINGLQVTKTVPAKSTTLQASPEKPQEEQKENHEITVKPSQKMPLFAKNNPQTKTTKLSQSSAKNFNKNTMKQKSNGKPLNQSPLTKKPTSMTVNEPEVIKTIPPKPQEKQKATKHSRRQRSSSIKKKDDVTNVKSTDNTTTSSPNATTSENSITKETSLNQTLNESDITIGIILSIVGVGIISIIYMMNNADKIEEDKQKTQHPRAKRELKEAQTDSFSLNNPPVGKASLSAEKTSSPQPTERAGIPKALFTLIGIALLLAFAFIARRKKQ